MPHPVRICTVTPQPLAVVRARVTHRDLGSTIQAILAEGTVYTFLRGACVTGRGHNVILYWDQEDKALLGSDAGLLIEVGVQVSGPFEGQGRVTCSCTPGGTAVTVAHIGPYDRLGEAHAAIRTWCRDHGHPIAGPNWEVYGDWHDDPSQLRTDVFYLLK